MTSQAITDDLLAEYRRLAELCTTLSPQDWQRRSAFYGWTPWDEIAHLCYFDETALSSAQDPERFAREAAALGKRVAQGEEISAIARQSYGRLDGAALLERWRECHETLAKALAPLDAKARLAWYGPPMSARSFATARLMETWAHGQDVWDVVRRRRPGSARLKHIAHLGVTTFGWTFVNRGMPVPEVAPYLALAAPDGSTWIWGDAFVGTPRAAAAAEDFCLLVTQRRHLQDTGLQYTRRPGRAWLAHRAVFRRAARRRAGAGSAQDRLRTDAGRAGCDRRRAAGTGASRRSRSAAGRALARLRSARTELVGPVVREPLPLPNGARLALAARDRTRASPDGRTTGPACCCRCSSCQTRLSMCCGT